MEILLCQKILGWSIIWFSFYRICTRINGVRNPEYNCRIITLCHAVLVTLWSCHLTFFNGTNPYRVLGLPNTSAQEAILTMSLGYFIYDFIWCMYYQTEGIIMLIHHIVSIILLLVCLHLKVSGTEVVATIFGSEITSIFLNIRWFLKDRGLYKGTNVGLFVDFWFVILFLGVRIGVGGSLVYSVSIGNRSPSLVKFGGLVFYLINLAFLVQIFSFVRYRIKTLRRSSDKSNNYNGKKANPQSTNINGKHKHQEFNTNGQVYRKRNFDAKNNSDIDLPNAHL